jgi:DNA (cytosine-5)-methyltransferase 1
MHLFAGAGGGLLGDLILGHTPVVAVEWEPYACQVLRERAADGWFPNLSVLEGDVRLFDPSEYTGKVDCIHAGFPCQDLSNAGAKAGLGEGTRSGLYREVLRIARQVRPRYLFLENVSAILSAGLEHVLADLAAMGFSARWCCLRASDVGANHRRDRWWLLATMAHPLLDNEQGQFAECPDAPGRAGPQQRPAGSCGDGVGWWQSEPDVGRVADGVPARVHRLKALGNAQVPLQAAAAFRLLAGY